MDKDERTRILKAASDSNRETGRLLDELAQLNGFAKKHRKRAGS